MMIVRLNGRATSGRWLRHGTFETGVLWTVTPRAFSVTIAAGRHRLSVMRGCTGRYWWIAT